MSEVIIEIHAYNQWRRIGSVCDAEPAGSISSEAPDGRQVYLFGWVNGEGPGVWQSTIGVDIESTAVREVITANLDRLADLTERPYELAWCRGGTSHTVRFRAAQTAGRP